MACCVKLVASDQGADGGGSGSRERGRRGFEESQGDERGPGILGHSGAGGDPDPTPRGRGLAGRFPGGFS